MESAIPRQTNQSPILVVTPTLGESPWLKETVESVARTAATASCQVHHVLTAPADYRGSLQAEFPETRVIVDEERRGLYPALNAAVAACGIDWKWWTWINDDDGWRNDFSGLLQAAVGADRETRQVLYAKAVLVDEKGQRLAALPWCRHASRIRSCWELGLTPLTQQATLIGRAAWEDAGTLDVRYRLCADMEWFLRSGKMGIPFRPFKLEAAYYRMREGQLSDDLRRVDVEKAALQSEYGFSKVAKHRLWGTWLWFRLSNLRSYLERIRRVGWYRSNSLYGGRHQR